MDDKRMAEVRAVVRDEAKRIVDQNVALRLVLKRIVDDLPIKRDWLDPDLEREARALLAESPDDKHQVPRFMLSRETKPKASR